MARITVEDCLEVVPNRFELTLLAAKRARMLASGLKEPKVDWDNDKPTVVALREIAAGTTDFSDPIEEPELAFTLATDTSETESEAMELMGQIENTDEQAVQLEEGLLSECSIEEASSESPVEDSAEASNSDDAAADD